MIGDVLLGLFDGVSGLVLGLLPMGALVAGSMTLPTGWLYGYDVLNSFLPVSEALAAVSALLALRMLMLSLKSVLFVKSLLPFG